MKGGAPGAPPFVFGHGALGAAIRPYDERRLSVRFADGSEVVASRAGSQSLRDMVR
jgi:hypothetical protein